MAITKIHPIRRTLNKAVKYITNPAKTESELYVSTYACNRETIIQDFEYTQRQANYNAAKGTTLAQHAIQSFAKGEVTAEEAHAIGMELAAKLTDSKHEFIVATHLDKGHIHNHIIFNQVDFIDHKHFKSNIHTTKILRQLSDELCEAHGLSVIKSPKAKGKSYYEWQCEKKGISYKKRLKDNIDMVIPTVESYGEFLIKMQQLGYEIKTGKYDSFRMNEQERFTRSKTLGIDYTREAIEQRIKDVKNIPATPAITGPTYFRIWKYDQKLGLIENTHTYLLFIQSPYQRQKAAIIDAKKVAATYNLLKEKGIDSVSQLNKAISDSKSESGSIRDEIRDIESSIADINETIKYAERSQANKPVWDEYVKSGKSQKFYDAHRAELMIYESSQEFLKRKVSACQAIKLAQLRKEASDLESKRIDLSAKLDILKHDQRELEQAKKNIDIIMHQEQDNKSKDKKKEQSID